MPASPTLLERLGGPEALRAIIDDFIDRVTGDIMIGFHFQRVDKTKLKQREYEFAAGHLGGAEEYTGRPLRSAHAAHRVLGGQFNRRLVLLEQTLRDHDVDPDVIRHWVEHNASLREQITSDTVTECND